MNRHSERNQFPPPQLFKFDNLENHVQDHLKRVYGCLSISMFTAFAGAYVHLYTAWLQAGILTMLASLGLMIWLASTHHSKETETKRLGIFAGFTFFTGMSLGPLLDYVITVDPSIIVTALMGTSVIFISFSLAALFNTNRTFLYMGGFLLSALSWLCLAGLLNIFIGSRLIWEVQLYAGLFIFCAFVLYDTQMIVEKKRMGDDDYIWHSVDLFLDFIQIFRRLLIILSNKDKKKEKN
ncbi:probable Bax inhibitor 1 [Mizuhopecten yessoensis]|uniref:Bax inhibitor 1 n=1 Tax=Mizuhopecten yessoensis TaxID=6573 RepID=A0A210PHQ6_MIZYE|nr:probable Bax inhibitor 1 [Mizuhopecten yessoensis]OWF36025.1 Bax inhibitor 1 [Mizuhopecten yessoensis]